MKLKQYTPYVKICLLAAVVAVTAIALPEALTYAQPCTTTPCYGGGGVEAGLGNAQQVGGIPNRGIRDIVLDILFTVLSFMALAAVVVIVIAGIYLVLSVGDEASKDRAKKIILYASVGLIIIALAAAIVTLVVNATNGQGLFGPIPDLGTGTDIRTTVLDILFTVLSFMALAAVVVIVIAGINLVLSLGDEQAKDRAKRIIYYAILGLVVIMLATAIVTIIAEFAVSN